MEKKKGVTILLTVFKITEEQFSYWNELGQKLSKTNNSIFILNDNPRSTLTWSENIRVLHNKVNKGKFKTVLDFVRKGLVQTTHIKVCDPDDTIDYDSFMTNSKNYIAGNTYVMKKKIITRNNQVRYEEVFSLPTCSTILDTLSIQNDHYFNDEMFAKNWIEDQLLGALSYINGASILKVNHSWYEYHENIGMTQMVNEDDAKEIISALKTFWELMDISRAKIQTSFPGNLKYLINLINNTDLLNDHEKNKYIKIISKYKEF